jgi:hypothetical protein
MRCATTRGGLFAIVLMLGACVQAQFVQTSRSVYPPRAPDCDMEVFATGVPDHPYEEIGIVEGEGDWWKSDLADVLPRLKEEACLAGGDALVLGESDRYAQGEEGIPVLRTQAVVIRWVGR